MADPTIKDVLAALAKLSTTVERVRDEMATKADLARVEAKVDNLEANVDKGFADLDADLERHMATHREIEKDIETLKKRPARTAARATRAPRRR